MKVRVKKTGEIKIVCDYARVQVEDCDSYGNPLEYSLDEVEIIQDEPTFQELKTERDWEQVRIKAALMAMQGVCSSGEMITSMRVASVERNSTMNKTLAEFCIKVSNSVVEELKKGG